jgi:hypothetical protein
VWYTWTPAQSGKVTISTADNFDTLLAVYTGSTVSALAVQGSNDGGASGQSHVTVAVSAGTAYAIAIDGHNGATGTIALTLNLVPYPANDGFANAVLLVGNSANATGSNVGATKEYGEPNHAGNAGGASVWYTWTPAQSGKVTISTADNFDTLLAVYTGSTVSALAVQGSNDGGASGQSYVTFVVAAGTAYAIAIDGHNGVTGTISLNLSLVPYPANDNFANAIVLTGGVFSVTGTNVGATKEAGEPNHAGLAGGASVWYAWTPTQSGIATIDTIGSGFDTLLAAYTENGISFAGLVPVASNNNISGTLLQSRITITVTAGTTYYIAVDGFNGATGAITLNFELVPTGPG